MSTDPDSPLFKADPQPNGAIPPLPPVPEPDGVKQFLATVSGLCLALFLVDAVIALADESLILFFNAHLLTVIRGIIFFFSILLLIVIYVLMGLTPMIPKRVFLPLTLFHPVAGLAVFPFLIYFYSRLQQVAWAISFCQVVVGLVILYCVKGGFKFRWPLIAVNQLKALNFSWRNLLLFVLGNVFVLLPAIFVYLCFCAAAAVKHFSDGFVALRPGGLTVQVRKYIRNDGRTILLVPMSHVGEPEFYQSLSQSFPSNAVVLMEGVTDHQNLLTNKLTYKRMANALGVSEQKQEFKPQGELIYADVDVEVFSTNTIDCLNLITLIHSKGANAETIMKLTQFAPPNLQEELFDDLLRKRNRHLIEEIHARFLQSENIIVPWGAAHMPEIAKEIQKSGFVVSQTHEYVAIRFFYAEKDGKDAGRAGDSQRSE